MTRPAVTLQVPETPVAPGPARIYATNADRQRAYRQRCQEARPAVAGATELPPLPALSQVPGYRRWRALIQHAHQLLGSAQAEMQVYYDQRSTAWQEGERGESFLERLEALGEAYAAVAELPE